MKYKYFQPIFLAYLLLGLFATTLTGQRLWSDIDERVIDQNLLEEKIAPSSTSRTVALDLQQWEQIATQNPSNLSINLPLPTGELLDVIIKEAPILEKKLADKFPAIKTYTIAAPSTIKGRISYTPNGVHALLYHPAGMVFIEPIVPGNASYHSSYFAKDQSAEEPEVFRLSCGTIPKIPTGEPTQATAQSRSSGNAVDLKMYRLLISTTGEFAQYHNARLPGEVLFEVAEQMNFINAIYEREFAIRFELIDETLDLIFIDPATDPYDGDRTVFSLLQQSSFDLETRVDVNKFDIGHILTSNCFPSQGGQAAGVAEFRSACTVRKSRGVSCQFQSNTRFATNIFAHEIGHQFGASHSWSNCAGSEDQRAETPYEPGSGSTIMSYAGACGFQNNVQQRADPYFHIANIEQVERHQESNPTCGSSISSENVAPEAIILQEEDLVIPILTPFELKGEAIDENGDDLTYSWEQFDVGPASILDEPRGNAPIFRSFPPSSNSNRVIPRLENIIDGVSENKEVLPDYSRDITFRYTVRDNYPESGGVDWKEIAFKSSDTAGPFLVEFPNRGTDVVRVGEAVNVQWAVANTNTLPVNCQKVDIFLSLDGGRTYPEILAREVDNDGSQVVTIPQITSNRARIKVAAADNIFFDISDFDFDILNPTQAGFSFATSIQSKEICLPEQVDIDLNTVSLLEFEESIVFDVVDGLPEGATATFEAATTTPGSRNRLNIDFQNVSIEGDFEVEVRGIATNADTISRTIDFNLIRNDFSDLQLITPATNSQGVASVAYTWQASEDALTYDIEIATSPTFGNTVVDRAVNLQTTEYPSRETLDPSTIYYWRVLPSNECGVGTPSEIFAFQTEQLVCNRVESGQVPLFISAQGTPTLQSTLDVTQDLIISDINVLGLEGRHDQVRHIATRLISPNGTVITLFGGECFSVPINLNFDDESLVTELCPANDGQTKVPAEPLATFDGENANGTWILEVEVINTDGAGGSIDAWGLELCSNASVDPPLLVTNTILPVQPTKGRVITNEFLLSEDANNTPSELTYTIIALPASGALQRGNATLRVGETFTQEDLDSERIVYKNEEGSIVTHDDFRFDVTDGEGGWIGITSFDIVLDDTELITDIEELEVQNLFTIYPNPAKEVVQLSFPNTIPKDLSFSLMNSQGQVLVENSLPQRQDSYSLSVASLSEGIYFIQVQSDDLFVVKKIIVQR